MSKVARGVMRREQDENGEWYSYMGAPRTNGWKREPKNYWSDDPLLAWRGACTHADCKCDIVVNVHDETMKVCPNADCPWGIEGPPAEKNHVEKRFAGLDFA